MNDEPSQRRAREGPEVNIRMLGIDLAKNVFRVHGVDASGIIRRGQRLPFMAQLPT